MKSIHRQKGAVLIVSLLFLLILSIIGVSSLRSGMMEHRMTANEQDRQEAFQMAQSAIEEMALRANIIVTGVVGEVVGCNNGTGCDLTFTDSDGIAVGGAMLDDSAQNVRITRLAPETSAPPRLSGREFSVKNFSATYFNVRAEHNTKGQGQWAAINQGYLVIIPKN